MMTPWYLNPNVWYVGGTLGAIVLVGAWWVLRGVLLFLAMGRRERARW